ncbi:MAG TPA: PEP-CTERM sorting domain-containing protein [Verrucomicrobiae bacterium]|nr:PEP-CTERM sorting domain-containing protein [Verrucomicrobiae bacterium]
MKNLNHTLLAAVFTATITATTAYSQPVITVDEFGNGNIGGSPLPSGLALDPFSGMTTLSYTLPFPAVRGDVILTDVSGTVSDIFRFDGNFTLYVYSDTDLSEPNPSPADVGFPAALEPNTLFAVETGPEPGLNGLFNYNPGTTGPGANSAGATYNLISDAAPTPEPGSLALLAGGLGVFGFGFLHRKRSHA